MRKTTIRSGLRFMATGMILLMLVTFFPGPVARLLFLGMADEARLILFGFFLGGIFGGWGVVLAALGLLQSGSPGEMRVRLMPTVMLLFSLIVLFFILTYNSMTRAIHHPPTQPGESINI